MLGLIGTVTSVLRNEAAICVGRRTLVTAAMAACVIAGCSIGFAGAISYSTAVVVRLVYGFIVWLDSSSPTGDVRRTEDYFSDSSDIDVVLAERAAMIEPERCFARLSSTTVSLVHKPQ